MNVSLADRSSITSMLCTLRRNVDRFRDNVLRAKDLAPKSVDQYIRPEQKMLRRERIRIIRLLEEILRECETLVDERHVRCILSDLKRTSLERRASYAETLLFCARICTISEWGTDSQYYPGEKKSAL